MPRKAGQKSSKESLTVTYKRNREPIYFASTAIPLTKNFLGLMWSKSSGLIQEFLDKKVLGYPHDISIYDGFHEVLVKPKEKFYIISLNFEWEDTIEQIAILAHEVNHFVFSLFKDRGYHIPCNRGNDEEHFNEYIQNYMRWCLEILRGNKKECEYLFEDEK